MCGPGAKHNDLDNVGFTARHHTFFEMLGNFSFGDYFKADAINWAWEFVTTVIKIPVERLSVTVFRGEDGIPGDEEAAQLWEKVGVPRHRIERLGKADNFLSMARLARAAPAQDLRVLPESQGRRNAQAWSIRRLAGDLEPGVHAVRAGADGTCSTSQAVHRHRRGPGAVTAYFQGKKSNYDTDLFAPLFATIEKLSGRAYGARWDSAVDAAMRIIADHARATAFLVADGVQPSNEKRGYVLRRIMRRAIRHGDQHLELHELFFGKCVEAVIDAMGDAYPELGERRGFILEVTRHEEEAFRRTLRRGLSRLSQEFETLRRGSVEKLSGDIVWDLHQTYGFLGTHRDRRQGGGLHHRQSGLRETPGVARGRPGLGKSIADIYKQLAPPCGAEV